MVWKILLSFYLVTIIPIVLSRNVIRRSQQPDAASQLISHLFMTLGREACYAPPGGVMSPECVAHSGVIGSGSDGCSLFYEISGPDSFNLCCDGYGLGGWHDLGCDHGSFTGKSNSSSETLGEVQMGYINSVIYST